MMCIVFIVDDGGSPLPSPPMDTRRRRGEGINAIVSMINGASNAMIAMTIDVHHGKESMVGGIEWNLWNLAKNVRKST